MGLPLISMEPYQNGTRIVVDTNVASNFYADRLEVEYGDQVQQANQLKNRRGDVSLASLKIEPKALFKVVASQKSLLEKCGFFDVSIELAHEAITARARLGRDTDLSFRVTPLPDGIDLILHIEDAMIWGIDSRPAPLVAHKLLSVMFQDLKAVGDLKAESLGLFRWAPLEQLLKQTFPVHGFRLPRYRHLQFVSIRTTSSGIEWLYGKDASAQQTIDARRRLNAQSVVSEGDRQLLNGDFVGAAKFYTKILENCPPGLEPVLAKRLLSLAASGSADTNLSKQFAAQIRARSLCKNSATLTLASLALRDKNWGKAIALFRTLSEALGEQGHDSLAEISLFHAAKWAIEGNERYLAAKITGQLLDSGTSSFVQPKISELLDLLDDWTSSKRLLLKRVSNVLHAEEKVEMALEQCQIARRVDKSGQTFVEHLQYVFSLCQGEFDLLNEVAKVCLHWGFPHIAVEAIEAALTQHSRSNDSSEITQLRITLSECYIESQNPHQGKVILSELLKTNPTDEVILARARIATSEGKFQFARELLGQTRPSSKADLILASCFAGESNLEAAEGLAKKIVRMEKSPRQVAEAHGLLGSLGSNEDLMRGIEILLDVKDVSSEDADRLAIWSQQVACSLSVENRRQTMSTIFFHLRDCYPKQASEIAWEVYLQTQEDDSATQLMWLDRVDEYSTVNETKFAARIRRAAVLHQCGNSAGAKSLLRDLAEKDLSSELRQEYLVLSQNITSPENPTQSQIMCRELTSAKQKSVSDYSQLASHYMSQLSLDEIESSELLTLLIDAQFRTRQFEALVKLGELEIELQSGDPYFQVALAYSETGRRKESIAKLETAVTRSFQERDFELDAWKLLLRLLKLEHSPDYCSVLERGAANSQLPKGERLDMFVRAGNLYRELGELQLAVNCFEQAVTLSDKTHLAALDGLDAIYSENDDPGSLAEVLQWKHSVISSVDRQKHISIRRAKIFTDLDLPERAFEVYQELLDEDGNYRPALDQLPQTKQRLTLLADFLPGDGKLDQHFGAGFVDASRKKAALALANAEDDESREILTLLMSRLEGSDYGNYLASLLPEQGKRNNVEKIRKLVAVIRSGDTDNAFEMLLKLKKSDSLTYEDWIALENAYSEIGDVETVATILQEQLRTTDDVVVRTDILLRLAKYFRDVQHDAARSFSCARDAWHESPTNTECRHLLKTMATARGEWNLVVELLEQSINDSESEIERSGYLLESAMVHEEKLLNPKLAISLYEKALTLDANIRAAPGPLSKLHAANQNFDRATELALVVAKQRDRGDSARWIALAVDWAKLSGDSDLIRKTKALLQEKNIVLNEPTTGNELSSLMERLEYADSRDVQDKLAARILELDQGDDAAFKLVAEYFERTEQFEKLARSIKTYRTDVPSLLKLAYLYRDTLELPAEAMQTYEMVLKDSPDNLEALQSLTDLHFAEANWKQALKGYKTLGKLSALGSGETAYRMGVCYEGVGDMPAALASLQYATKDQPADRRHLSALARAAEHCKDYHAAHFALKELLDLETDNSTAVIYLAGRLGDLTLQAGELAKATSYYSQVIARDSRNYPTLRKLVDIALRRKNYPLAANHLDTMIGLAPSLSERADVMIELGQLQATILDRRAEAMDVLTRAIDIAPGNATALRLLISLHWDCDEFANACSFASDLNAQNSLTHKDTSEELLGKVAVASSVTKSHIIVNEIVSFVGQRFSNLFRTYSDKLSLKDKELAIDYLDSLNIQV